MGNRCASVEEKCIEENHKNPWEQEKSLNFPFMASGVQKSKLIPGSKFESAYAQNVPENMGQANCR